MERDRPIVQLSHHSIVPSIHKISLFSKDYDYGYVTEKLGKFKVLENNYYHRFFSTSLIRHYKNFFAILLVNPIPLIRDNVKIKLNAHHQRHINPKPKDIFEFLKDFFRILRSPAFTTPWSVMIMGLETPCMSNSWGIFSHAFFPDNIFTGLWYS